MGGPGLTHEPASKKEMMDNVLGKTYRGKGVLKYVLGKADQRLRASVGFRVKCPPPHHAYYVKDTYYVINTLVRRGKKKANLFICTRREENEHPFLL